MELNKLCRTCLSASEDMQSLYEACATSTQICCAIMLSNFTPLICFKDDGLPTMICRNCIREVNRCYTFRLKCLASDGVLRKHVPRVIGVAATNITVTNEQTESRNQDSIKLEADMDEDSRIFEEVSITNEFSTSSKKEQSATSLKDPLSLTEMQKDMNQTLDIVKHEIDVINIKIDKDGDKNVEANNAPVNEEEKDKPFSCPVCNKAYTNNHNLKIHMRSHTGEKPYSCTECGIFFKSRKQLMSHMRTHSEAKPYTCSICDKTFKHMQNLKSHTRTHTGEKPYSCTLCDGSFKQMSHLTTHLRTHTGEKPYPCKECDSTFKSKQGLMFHNKKHTKEIS